MARHGLNKTREHKAWTRMLARSRHQGSNGHYYKELDVDVCDEWNPVKGGSFLSFLFDMGECPDGMTLDRIDNRLGYSKENCQWASKSQQGSNRRKNTLNKSGRIGVYWDKDKSRWRVVLKVDKKAINVGRFISFEEACEACEKAELLHLGYSRKDY